MTLFPEHKALLEKSAIDLAVAEEAGVRSATSRGEYPECFRTDFPESIAPGLVFEWRSVADAERIEYQVRPDEPRDEKGKYLFRKDGAGVFAVHPRMRDRVEDAGVPLIIVEGTKQYLSAVSAIGEDNIAAIGMAGCYGWKKDGEPIDDLFALDVLGRDVAICLDADITSNREVWDGGHGLRDLLVGMGADVTFMVLPGGGTMGLDDLLGKARGEDARKRMVTILHGKAVSKIPGRAPAVKKVHSNSFITEDGLQVVKLAVDILENVPMALNDEDAICVYDAKAGVYRRHRDALVGPVVARLKDDYRGAHKDNAEDVVRELLSKAEKRLPERAPHAILNTATCMVDLATLETHPHDPRFLSSQQLPVAWDPEAECPVFDEWISKTANGQADDLLESTSVMLDPTVTPAKAIFLYGPSRTGKSTYLRLIEALVGPYNRSAVTLHQLDQDRFAAANVYGMLLNSAADLAAGYVEDLSMFKMLTGDDPIQANRKYGRQFTFRNAALFAFSANEVPTVSETSTAYTERVKPFWFRHSFAGAENPDIERAMMAELPGILQRLARAYQAFQARGGYRPTNPDVLEEFEIQSDRVRQWLRDRRWKVADPSIKTSAASLLLDFSVWCGEQNFKPLGRNKFNAKLGAVRGVVQGLDPKSKTITFNITRYTDSGPEEDSEGFETTLPSRGEKESEVVERAYEGRVGKNPPNPPSSLSGLVAVDFETPDANKLFTGGHEGPFTRLLGWTDDTGSFTTSDPDEMRAVLTGAERMTTHNGWAFDLPAAARHLDLDVEELVSRTDDIMVQAKLVEPPRVTKLGHSMDRYDLGTLAPRYAGREKAKDVMAALKRQHKGYDKIPVDDPDYTGYCKLDCELTRDIATALVVPDAAYYERERRVAGLAASLTVRGLRVDPEALEQRLAERGEFVMEALDHLTEFGFDPSTTPTSKPWNRNTAVPILDRLAQDSGAPRWPRTEKGNTKTDGDTWEAIRDGATGDLLKVATLVCMIVEENDSFLYGVQKSLTPEGRVYPMHKISAATGRWSTTDPNTLGSGKRSDLLLSQRQVILAEPGEEFVAIDLAAIDSRAVWGLSGDEVFGELFAPGVDIHNAMAELYFGEASKANRTASKTITHGIPYGRQAKAITDMIFKQDVAKFEGLGKAEIFHEVDTAIKRYYERYTGVLAWQERVRKTCEAGGIEDNGFGRGIRTARGKAFTAAPARLAQSAARDLAMEGLFRVKDAGLWDMARLFVHDELVLSVPEGRADEIGQQVAELMSFTWDSPSGVQVPIVAVYDGSHGPRWYDCYIND